MVRFTAFLVFACTALAQSPSSEELRGVMRQVLVNLQKADEAIANYGYDRYNVRRELDSNGRIKSEHTFLARRSFIEGEGFTQQIQRDGAPVPAADLEREREAFRQRQAALRAMPEAQREQTVDDELRKRREDTSWIKEFPEALRYRKVGEETIDGRVAIVLECEPQPGYKARNLRARVYEKVRGRVWVDKAETQVVRIEARVFEDVNIGWGLAAKVYKGTEFHLERRRLPEGTWLPMSQSVKFAARLLLVKALAQEESTRYSEYRHKSAAVLASEKDREAGARSPAAAAR